MKRKIVMALVLSAAVAVSFAGCGSKNKKSEEPVAETGEDEKEKQTADEIEESKIVEAVNYRAVLGDYTVSFEAEKGFVQDKEEQMPEESRKLGARAVKYTNTDGDEIFIAYTPEEMTPNIGIAKTAEEYMKLEEDGTTSKWAEDIEAGNWKGYHYKATTNGSNQVGYDLHYDSQEIRISLKSSSDEDYPLLDKISVSGERKSSGQEPQEKDREEEDEQSSGETSQSEEQSSEEKLSEGIQKKSEEEQAREDAEEGDPEEESEEAPEGAGDPDGFADEDGD